MVSHPELGSDPPIGSGRESGCDIFNLEGYSNADWATSIDDRKSVSGVCIFLRGNLISWSSKK